MRFIEIPALITEDIEDPDIVYIRDDILASIDGTTLTIDGDSKVSGEASVTLTGDVNINAVSTSNLRTPSIHKITIKTNGTGNFTYVPNAGVTASSVSTTTKTGSDLEILLITTSGGETYLDLDVADYVSPAANFSNVLTGFKVSELTSTYGATAKLYKPDGTLLTTVNSETMGSGVNFGYTESPGDVIYKLEVTDDLGRKSTYNLPRKWINYAMGTTSTPGFQKFRLEGIDYTTTMTLPSLGSSSTAKVYRTSDHGYMGIKFKIQGRNAPSDDWVDIANADENDDVLAFGDYLYHRVWVKPTAKATTTVSSSNVVTLTLSNLTEENVTTSFTGADPFEIDETSNVFVFEETAKIGTVPFTVTLGTETYTNAVTATTEEVSTVPNTDMTAAGPNKLHDIQLSQTGGYMSEASGNGKYIAYNKTNDSVVYILKGDPVSGYTDYTTITYSQVTNAYLVGSMTYDGKYIIIARRGSNSYHYEIWKHDESAETYTKLSQTVQTIDTSTYVHKPAFVPAEGNYNFAISGHNSSSGQDFSVQLYKHTVGTDTWTAQTIISNPRPSSVQGTTSNRSMQAKSFTKDGKYLMFGNTSTYGGYDVFNVDFDENTVTHAGNWVNNGDIGHSGSITSDGKYILLFDDDSNSRKIFKNNDAGDWSSSTDVTSDFTFEDTDNDQGYGICFFGENSEYFVSTGASGGAVRVYRWYPKKEVTLTFSNPTLTLTGQNVTISSAKLYKDDVLFHTYGTESNVVLRSDQTGTYQAIVNDVYYSNRVTPDFTTTRSVSAPQLEFDGYNRLSLNNITPTSTTLGVPDGTTRDLTTQSNVYIYKSGTYTANVQTSETFAYLSNVVTGEITIKTSNSYNLFQNFGTTDYTDTEGRTIENLNSYSNGNLSGSDLASWTDRGWTYSGTINLHDDAYNVTGITGDISTNFHGSGSTTGYFDKTLPSGAIGIIIRFGQTYNNSTGRAQVFIYNNGTEVTSTSSKSYSTTLTEETLYFPASPNNVIRLHESGTGVFAVTHILTETYTVTPKLTFDGFNKLSIENITQTSSTLEYGSNTYDTNTASNVYVTDAGEYVLEASDANTFVTSNVEVGALDTVPGFTAAFHHGAFSASDYSSAYSSVADAATAGFVYSDTPAGEYTWGTLAHVKERENPDFTANSTLHTDYSSTYGWGDDNEWEVSAKDEFSSTYEVWKAFSKTYASNNNWLSGSAPSENSPQWIKIKYPSQQVIKSYVIRARENASPRWPTAWKLQGSNNDSEWTDIGTEQTQTEWVPNQNKSFDLSTNTTAYQYYRLRITGARESASSSNSDYVAIGHWFLFTETSGSTVHTKYTRYTYTPPASTITANVLRVAGGGGGSGTRGGGGGAGGLLYSENVSLSGTKSIVVGNGGIGYEGTQQSIENGYDTVFTGLTTSIGGGHGGGNDAIIPTPGGSGGGGSARIAAVGTGAAGTSGQGNAGGNGSSGDTFNGGGGGGAGAVGGDSGGVGGVGLDYSSVFGTTYGVSGFFAGGGGGGTSSGGNTGGNGGGGGGSYGHGTKHTGGGGAGIGNGSGTSGDGGSGIVLIKKLGPINPPTLNFDGYNKLTIDNVDTVETATIKKDGAAFATTTSDTVYIRDTGTYTAEVKGSGAYVTELSKVVSVINNAPDWSETQFQILYSENPNQNDYFGIGVDIDGDYACIGSPYDDTNGGDKGAVYVFHKSNGVWTYQDILQPDSTSENFAVSFTSLSIHGDTIAVGAQANDTGGTDFGAVYVFRRNGTSWSKEAKLQSNDVQTSDNFGSGVGIYGDYIVAGAYAEDSGGNRAGSAYIFKRTDTTWQQKVKIQSGDQSEDDKFGMNCKIYGDYVIVGALEEDIGGTEFGAAYIFKKNADETWSKTATLLASDGAYLDRIGVACYIYDEYAIVGGPTKDNGGTDRGSAYIFKKNADESWTEQAILTSDDPIDNYSFGTSVYIKGNYAIVGEPGNDANTGSFMYVFERSGSSWTQVKKFQVTNGQNANFGSSVAISGDTILSGAPYDDVKNVNAGACYVFSKTPPGPYAIYDNYNKITLNQLNYEDTATVSDPNGSTYNIGTAKTMYVKDIGDYVFKISGTDKYVESNVHVSSVDLAGAPTKPIDFDGYNKLTLIDAGSNVLANVTYFSNTYELGSANVLYINGAGTYDLEMSGSNVFALSSNVTGPIDQNGPTYTPGIQWSFNNTLAPTIDDTQIDYNTTSLVNASVSTNSALVTRHTISNIGTTQYATKGGHTALRIGASYAHYLGKAQHIEVLDGTDGSNMWKDSKNMFMSEWTVEISVYFDGSVPTSTGTILGYYASGANEILQIAGSRFVAGFWYTEGGTTPNQAEYHMDKTLSANTWYDVKIVNIPYGSGWKMKCYINDEFVEGYDIGNGIKIGSSTENSVRTRDTLGHVDENESWMMIGRRYGDITNSPVECYIRNLKFYPGNIVESFASPPSLTFDGYNKLTLENFTTTESDTRTAKLTDPNGSTYALGQTQDTIYIHQQGDYTLDVQNNDQKAIVAKNVTGGISQAPPSVGSTIELHTPQSGSTLIKSLTCKSPIDSGSFSFSVNGVWATSAVLDSPIEQTTNSDHNFTLSELSIFNNNKNSRLTQTGMLSSGTNSKGSPVDREFVFEFENFIKLTTFTMWDGRSDWTYTQYEIWLGDDLNNLYKEATVSNSPTTQWDNNNNTNSSTYSPSSSISSYKYLVLKNFVVPNNIAGLGIAEIYIYGYVTSQEIIPSLTFDGYNKLSIENLTPTSTRLTYGSNTYEIGTASNVYIEDAGTYKMATGDANTFALVSNVVGTISTPVISPFTSTQNDITITGGTENPARYYKFDTLNSNSSKLFYENYTISNDVHNINKGISFYYDANDNLVVNHNDTNGSGDPGAIENVTTSSGFLNSGVVNASPGDIIRGRPGDNTSTLRVQYTVPTFNQGTPSLTFDTSNKLSIENITPTSTILTDPNGSSFDIGTASNVYIRDSGKYSIASKDANTFVLASNTVTGTPTGTTYVYDSNTFTTPSQTYDTTKTITVSNVPSTQTGITGKIYKGATAYTIHATTSSSNVIIKNTGTYVSVFTTASTAYLTNTIDVTATPTSTDLDNTIEDSVPLVTVSGASSIVTFHHGTFVSGEYGYTDVATASTAGFVYANTQRGTYTWGELTANTLTTSNTAYTWTPTADITGADMLMVAGGGGGGGTDYHGGGGGAGGVITQGNLTISGQQSITVGNGSPGYNLGLRGYNSVFNDLTAIGGGAGGASDNTGYSGGSGGGSGVRMPTDSGGAGTPGQGFDGGGGYTTSGQVYAASGGGGAGGVGENGSDTKGGDGGAGISSNITGTLKYYAGGGGGSVYNSTESGLGGVGGGGDGAYGSGGGDGERHTGSGGGGRDSRGTENKGSGNGGSGIVIIKYVATTTTGGLAGSTAVPDETTTDAPSVTLDATDTTVTDPTLDLDFTATLPRTLKRYNGVTNSSIGARFNRHETNKKRIEKSISIPSSFSAELTANNASSPTTLTVTVANSKFVINGDETPTLGFIRGETYTFDQSDASNSGHPLVLATSEDGTQYTTGWTASGTPGTDGSHAFIVPYDVPDTIYYKCNVHSNMGGEIHTTFGNVFSLGDFTVAANTHVSGEYTLATNYDGTTSNLYVNGDLISQTTPSPAISAGVKDFILGKEFDGYVKNFKFWNYVKSSFAPPIPTVPGTFQKNGINGNSTLYFLLGARKVEATPWYSTYHMPQTTSKADAFAITSSGTSIANGGVNTSQGTYPTSDPGPSIGSGHVVANSFHFATDMTKIDKIYFLSANGAYGLEFSLQDYADVPAPASGGGDVGGTITITDKFGYTATSIYALKRVSNAEDPWINTGTNHNYTQMFYGDSTGDAGGSHMSSNGGFYIYASLS
jgi:hypothetical protein